MHIIAKKLIKWYDLNKRDLPWRRTTDPYKIWVSEIILQQTRVDQGMQYYYRFIERFPDVNSLAAAEEQEVLKLWQGLGYYSRARNMHRAAKTIAEKYNGRFPEKYREVLSLKGIGEYTAGAIASFAFGKQYPAVDGNVMRVLSRLFEIKDKINTSAGKKKIKAVAESIISDEDPGKFNQALIEFGALHCLPKKPLCQECPLQENCMAFANNTVGQLPAKKPKKKPRDRYLNYLVIHNKSNAEVYLRKRKNSSDIWQNLYDFPLIESEKPLSAEELLDTDEWSRMIGQDYTLLKSNPVKKKHQLSHQTLHAHFWEIEMKKNIDFDKGKDFIKDIAENLHEYPFPRLIDAYLKENVEAYDKNYES